MSRIARLAAGVAVAGLTFGVSAPAAFAQSVDCVVYADACVESEVITDNPAPTVVQQPPAITTTRTTATPSALPFTGGEVLLIGLVGGGALAAGAVLVVATRRRGVTAA